MTLYCLAIILSERFIAVLVNKANKSYDTKIYVILIYNTKVWKPESTIIDLISPELIDNDEKNDKQYSYFIYTV